MFTRRGFLGGLAALAGVGVAAKVAEPDGLVITAVDQGTKTITFQPWRENFTYRSGKSIEEVLKEIYTPQAFLEPMQRKCVFSDLVAKSGKA